MRSRTERTCGSCTCPCSRPPRARSRPGTKPRCPCSWPATDHGYPTWVPQRREESTMRPRSNRCSGSTPTTAPRGSPCARGSAAARGTRPCHERVGVGLGCGDGPRRRPADATKRTGRVGTFRRTRGGREARALRLTARERARRATPRTSPRAEQRPARRYRVAREAHGGPARAGLLGCAASAWQWIHNDFRTKPSFFLSFRKIGVSCQSARPPSLHRGSSTAG